MGWCATGADTQDAVQCAYSATPVGAACGVDEWLAGTLTPAFSETNASQYDTGTPRNPLHPFRSDVSADASKVVYLASSGSSDVLRQTVVKVALIGSGHVANYVYPRAAFFNRLDVSGSQHNASTYPVATLLDWNAVDVMFSYDSTHIYLFFSHTYDFIARCRLSPLGSGSELQSSDCAHLSPASLTDRTTVFRGCVRLQHVPATGTGAQHMACLYEVGSGESRLLLVDEVSGSKVPLDTHGFRRPRSPPAWNPAQGIIYYVVDVNSGSNHAVRFVKLHSTGLNASSVGFLYQVSSVRILMSSRPRDNLQLV